MIERVDPADPVIPSTLIFVSWRETFCEPGKQKGDIHN